MKLQTGQPWPSPAKLNLFLHINNKRLDGYHNLQTLFQFIDFCDELYFDITEDSEIILETPINGVDNQSNLIVRAAQLLHKQTHYQRLTHKPGVKIRVTKNLPMGGGLGGGSSNAATTLVALNHLWKLGLSIDELKSIGLELGADVPVFIHGEACLAEGVGEQFSKASPEECWYLILTPDCHVNTGEIFSNPSLTRNSKTIRIRAQMDWEILGELRNDCESLVRTIYPEINQVLNWISKYGIARLTGTGCCVFSPFQSELEARKIAALVPNALFPHKVGAFVAKGVNQSPLIRELKLNS